MTAATNPVKVAWYWCPDCGNFSDPADIESHGDGEVRVLMCPMCGRPTPEPLYRADTLREPARLGAEPFTREYVHDLLDDANAEVCALRLRAEKVEAERDAVRRVLAAAILAIEEHSPVAAERLRSEYRRTVPGRKEAMTAQKPGPSSGWPVSLGNLYKALKEDSYPEKEWVAVIDAIRVLEAHAKELKAALKALYTFPGIRELLAPKDSFGSIAAQVEAALRGSMTADAEPGPALRLHKKWHKTCGHSSEGPCEQADAIYALDTQHKEERERAETAIALLNRTWPYLGFETTEREELAKLKEEICAIGHPVGCRFNPAVKVADLNDNPFAGQGPLDESPGLEYAYFDGECLNNNDPDPGKRKMRIAVVLHGETYIETVTYPVVSNNVAEYLALLNLMDRLGILRDAGFLGRVCIRGDSQLVVNQVTGTYVARQGHLEGLLGTVRKRTKMIGDHFLEWVPRGRNLAGLALDWTKAGK